MNSPNELPSFPKQSAVNPAHWSIDKAEEAYVGMDGLLADISNKHIIAETVYPKTASQAQKNINLGRTQVIGERLFLLGYWKKYTSKYKSRELKKARALFIDNKEEYIRLVEKFQSECHLKNDGIAGKKTWDALEQLVNFEGDSIPDIWHKRSGNTYPLALQRALQLRMSIFEIGKPPTMGFRSVYKTGLKHLRDNLFYIGLLTGNRDDTKPMDWQCIQLFLNHDRIIDGLCKSVKKTNNNEYIFNFQVDRHWRRQEIKQRVQEFIVQIAKIELWLLGVNLNIDKVLKYRVKGIAARRYIAPEKNKTLGIHIIRFYQELGDLSFEEAKQQARWLTPHFFRMIRLQEGVKTKKESKTKKTDSEMLAESMSETEVTKALATKQSIGMRIYDGFKRLFRWFKRVAKKIINYVGNKIRIFQRYAMKTFQVLRHSINAVCHSFKTFVSGKIEIPQHHSFIRIEKDLDFRVYVGREEQKFSGEWLGNRVILFADRFVFSSKILKMLTKALIHGFANNWAKIAIIFVQHMRDIIPLYHQIISTENKLGIS